MNDDARKVRFTPIGEQRLIAVALKSKSAREAMLGRLPQDAFVHEKHAVIWSGIRAAIREDVEPDDATLYRLTGGQVDLDYVRELRKDYISEIDEPTLQAHITAQRWDVARIRTLQGPTNAFLELCSQPGADPARTLALADQIASALRGYEDRRALYASEDLVREMRVQLSEARSGRSVYPYGISGIDIYESGHERAGQPRCIPGAKPGLITLLTAVSGSGKSTIAARMTLGQARLGKRVLYGAWEPGAADTMTLMALLDLGYSRTDISIGNFALVEEEAIAKRAAELGRLITIMDNPFALGTDGREKRPSNDVNVDLIGGYIADTGADIFVADLWERCLVALDEASERLALFRIQRLLKRRQCHGILLAQQRLKDVEVRPDCRPTREGIKGTSGWVDVADTIIGVHLPSLFKDVPADTLELILLKQRWGAWPMCVEFQWDADKGTLAGGKTVAYKNPMTSSKSEGFKDMMRGGLGR